MGFFCHNLECPLNRRAFFEDVVYVVATLGAQIAGEVDVARGEGWGRFLSRAEEAGVGGPGVAYQFQESVPGSRGSCVPDELPMSANKNCGIVGFGDGVA